MITPQKPTPCRGRCDDHESTCEVMHQMLGRILTLEERLDVLERKHSGDGGGHGWGT